MEHIFTFWRPTETESEFLSIANLDIRLIVNLFATLSYKLLNLVAKWPGSVHDSFIWQNCAINEAYRDGIIEDGWLLGDSGYAQEPWLMTPFLEPQTPSQRRYNVAHKRVRSTIERTIGIMKSRFRCLDQTAGKMLFRPERCCKVIMAVGILHNIARKRNLPIPIDDRINELIAIERQNEVHQNYVPNAFRNGVDVRQRLLETYFAN